jgi:hypothetical protein
MATGSNEISATAWVRVTLRDRKVVDVDGEIVSLEFSLDLPEDKAWYQCFAQTSGPDRTGSELFVDTNPHFLSAEVLAWKIELSDIPQVAIYLADRVNLANDLFCELLERKEQIRRQLEDAARRRTEAIEHAQRVLDASWPTEPDPACEPMESKGDTSESEIPRPSTHWASVQAQGAH